MPARRVSQSEASTSRRAPAISPEQRENQLIGKAIDLAEKQIEDGTASAQVITHFLRLGSSREKLEQERLAHEVELMEAKREMMESAARQEELYKSALDAMRAYSGAAPQDDYDDYED